MPRNFAFDGFPDDDRFWWLVWMDHLRWDRRTSTPGVTVRLAALPDVGEASRLPTLAEAVALSSGQATWDARVQVGLVPGLCAGMVFRRQRQVGFLPMERRTFRFERTRCRMDMDPVSDDACEEQGALPLIQPSTGTLPPGAYPLDGFQDSLSVRIRRTDGQGEALVLPCFEVFRIMMAPHRAIALALTRGPWSLMRRRVTRDDDLRPTRAMPDGTWHVSLAGGVSRHHLAVLGNLVLNPAGMEAAEQVRLGVLRPSRWMKVRSNAERAPGRFQAPIPFQWESLELEVDGLQIATSPSAWLGLRLLAWTWPPPPLGPPAIKYLPSRDTRRGATQAAGAKTARFRRAAESLRGERQPRVRSDIDPSRAARQARFEAPGAIQKNAPKVTKAPKPASHLTTNRPGAAPDVPVDAASAGNRVPGRTGAAVLQTSASGVEPGPSRFEEVVTMLDKLRERDDIEKHSAVEPGPQGTEQRGAVAAWRLPAPPFVGRSRSSWYRIDGTTVRGAMVREVVTGGASVLWVEVEPRPGEARLRSLVFHAAAGPDGLPDVILALLRALVERRGVWPPQERLRRMGVTRSDTWSHQRTHGAFDYERALDAIRSVAAS